MQAVVLVRHGLPNCVLSELLQKGLHFGWAKGFHAAEMPCSQHFEGCCLKGNRLRTPACTSNIERLVLVSTLVARPSTTGVCKVVVGAERKCNKSKAILLSPE